MYRAFDLKVTNKEIEDVVKYNSTEQIKLWNNIGWQCKQEFKDEYNYLLKNYLNDGTINGTKLIKEVFDKNNYDVFLSYSHNDEKLVLTIAGMLIEQFNLNVFVDTFYWGSADDLLKEIDDIKCKNSDGTYDYQKRNITTSHVHAMLTSAIMQVMDLSEIVIFVNTNNSVPVLENTLSGKKEYTFSPWIYEEVLLTELLREKKWFEHRLSTFNERMEYKKEQDFEIAYELPKNNMINIDVDDIHEWIRINQRLNCSKNKKIRTKEDLELLLFIEHHPLNILYKIIEMKCETEKK